MDAPPSSKQKWTLTPESFDELLGWLDADRELAGERYEQIRAGLIKGFGRHGCREPEELADETINRVAKRLPEIIATYEGDPARYFYGVAHNVHKEYLRKPMAVSLPQTGLLRGSSIPTPESREDEERMSECLSACVEQLATRDRELIMQYYCGERQIKIRLRKEMAERMGIKLENLRLRAQRIRERLRRCIDGCMNQEAPV